MAAVSSSGTDLVLTLVEWAGIALFRLGEAAGCGRELLIQVSTPGAGLRRWRSKVRGSNAQTHQLASQLVSISGDDVVEPELTRFLPLLGSPALNSQPLKLLTNQFSSFIRGTKAKKCLKDDDRLTFVFAFILKLHFLLLLRTKHRLMFDKVRKFQTNYYKMLLDKKK